MVASVLMVSMLPGQQAGSDNHKAMETFRKLAKIEQATTGFMAAYGRRPCPADGQYDVDTANFGIEAANPGTCTGGTPVSPLGPDDGTGHIVGGVVPTKTLGLPDDYAFDGWGRRITYLVDKRATDKTSCLTLQNYPVNNGVGGITIKESTSGDSISGVMAAYVSHGPDGHGAFPMAGSSVANRIHIGSTDTDTLTNAGVNSSFTYSTANFTNTKVLKEKTMTYDDLTYYAEYQKNTCCLGKVCITPGFRIDGIVGKTTNFSLAKGDINCDNYTDLVLGLTSSRNHYMGAGALIIWGKASSPGVGASISNPDGTKATLINGPIGAVLGVDDITGDGCDDLILPYYANNGGGNNYDFILFGGSGAWPANVNIGDVNGYTGINGTSGVKLYNLLRDYSAYWTSVLAGRPLVGDVNGDGIKDVIIYGGNYHVPHYSMGYVLFGRPNGQWNAATINLQTELNGAKGFMLYTSEEDNPVDQYPQTSSSFHSNGFYFRFTGPLGDLNQDGYDDIILQDHFARFAHTPPGKNGHVYILWGRSNADWVSVLIGSAPARLDLKAEMDSTATPTSVTVLYDTHPGYGAQNNPFFGSGNNVIADLNGDGVDDLLLTGIYQLPAVLYGSTSAWPATKDMGLVDGTDGFRIIWNAPAWVSYFAPMGDAADVNRDGRADLLLSCTNCSPNGVNNAGSIFVIYGPPGGWPAVAALNVNTIAFNGADGFRIDGALQNSNLMWPLVLDINRDSKPDIIINAAGNNGDLGAAYGIYGGDEWPENYNLNELH